MKKYLIALLIPLLAIIIGFIAAPMPNVNLAQDSVAVKGGTYYFIQNDSYSSLLFSVKDDGATQLLYSEMTKNKKNAQKIDFVGLTADEKQLYLLTGIRSQNSDVYTNYSVKIFEIIENVLVFQQEYPVRFDSLSNPTLSIFEDQLFFCEFSQNSTNAWILDRNTAKIFLTFATSDFYLENAAFRDGKLWTFGSDRAIRATTLGGGTRVMYEASDAAAITAWEQLFSVPTLPTPKRDIFLSNSMLGLFLKSPFGLSACFFVLALYLLATSLLSGYLGYRLFALSLSFGMLAVSVISLNAYFAAIGFIDDTLRLRLFEQNFVWLLLVCVFLLALFWAYLFSFLRPLFYLPKAIKEINEGVFNAGKMSGVRGEVGDIQKAVQLLDTSVSRRLRETSDILRFCMRFVPKDLEKAFGHDTISELSNTDTKVLTNLLGFIYVKLPDVSDEGKLKIIRRFYDELQGAFSSHNAWILSQGLEFPQMRISFDAPTDGAQFASRIIGSCKKSEAAPAVLLHESTYMYGIVGSDDKIYTQIISKEQDDCAAFCKRLAKEEVSIVITDKVYGQLNGEEFVLRHIGFKTFGQTSYKLYELLSVLSVDECAKRRSYDRRFQDTLLLYYKKDFFLARSVFTDLFKICPEDAVVKWYLFACERHLNDQNEINMEIFND